MPDPLILAPEDPSSWPSWRAEITAWRDEARKGYDDSAYRNPHFAWAASCYACAMVMVWDEVFLDAKHGRYKVEEVIRDGRERFGGYDAVVLWQAYPRIGFDDRNQFDFYRELPPGLPEAIRKFHANGVKVFLDYNPWDTGTRRENRPDALALADLFKELGADGLFLDTLDRAGPGFGEALKGVAFESEGALALEEVPTHHLSWAQWFNDSLAPGVLRNRWFERRHMQHAIRRWDTDHSGELQMAWMNGVGMLVWENVFGSWNAWAHRDRETLRAMLPIQRSMHRFFAEGEWTPLVPTTTAGLYASEWRLGGRRLWTLVNRSDRPVLGGIDYPSGSDERIYDLVSGHGISKLEVEVPARGIGCLYTTPMGEVDESLRSLIAAQSHRGKSKDKPIRPIRPISPIRPNPVAVHPGMVRIEGGPYRQSTRFRSRECGERGYAPFKGNAFPPLHVPVEEVRETTLKPFAIDEHEVTVAEYERFVKETVRSPSSSRRDGEGVGGGEQRTTALGSRSEAGEGVGGGENPVTHVNLDDARAYAKWAGKRLPTDAEWQLAAEKELIKRFEKPVWEWTESEYDDGHTRFCILKGGSWYVAKGSDWYADGSVREPEFAAKFIRISPALDRCATIGFRCAMDVA